MNWDEMIDYIKSEKIRIETENSKTDISNKTPILSIKIRYVK